MASEPEAFERVELVSLLERFGAAAPAPRSVLAAPSPGDAVRRGWCRALDRAAHGRGLADDPTRAWLSEELARLTATDASDPMRALAAEVEAALRLSWVGNVSRVRAKAKQRTCDLRVGRVNVEVYCPQEHVEERRVVEALLADGLRRASGPGRVATVISHPTTGSGRTVDEHGSVKRDRANNALNYPANKLIDRLLSEKKRAGTQLVEGELNVLWLDLKHGLGFTAVDCVPLRSIVAKGTCFVGTHGVWQGFYGCQGDPLYAERTVLEYAVPRGAYEQQMAGWFRTMPRASAALLSVLDGVLLWENPWAAVPLDAETRSSLLMLTEIRPEFSWFDPAPGDLIARVEAERRRISWIVAVGPAWAADRADAP